MQFVLLLTISANALPTGENDIYHIFLPPGTDECFSRPWRVSVLLTGQPEYLCLLRIPQQRDDQWTWPCALFGRALHGCPGMQRSARNSEWNAGGLNRERAFASDLRNHYRPRGRCMVELFQSRVLWRRDRG